MEKKGAKLLKNAKILLKKCGNVAEEQWKYILLKISKAETVYKTQQYCKEMQQHSWRKSKNYENIDKILLMESLKVVEEQSKYIADVQRQTAYKNAAI